MENWKSSLSVVRTAMAFTYFLSFLLLVDCFVFNLQKFGCTVSIISKFYRSLSKSY